MSGIYDGEWQLIKETPFERVWLQPLDASGVRFVCKRETLVHSAVAEANAEELKATEGQRFGDSRLVARIPMDVWQKELGAATQDGDLAFKKKWLNRPENAHWRTFKGNL